MKHPGKPKMAGERDQMLNIIDGGRGSMVAILKAATLDSCREKKWKGERVTYCFRFQKFKCKVVFNLRLFI